MCKIEFLINEPSVFSKVKNKCFNQKWNRYGRKTNMSISCSPEIAIPQTARDGYLAYMTFEDSFDHNPECRLFCT